MQRSQCPSACFYACPKVRIAIVALCVLALAVFGGRPASAGPHYFSTEDGIALSGYDPVSFFVAEAPEHGHRSHAVMWKGAVWLFGSAENRLRFESNPRAYAPRFGGHCAYGMARGRIYDGSPLSWEIVDGHLFLFNNPGVEALWLQEQEAMIHSARAVWPEILHAERSEER